MVYMGTRKLKQHSLGFVTCHFVGEDALEEGPDARHVVLRGCHIDVNRPQIPAFRVRVDDPLEDGFSAFRFAELVFELSEL